MAHKHFAILDESKLVINTQVGADDGISTEEAMANHMGVDTSDAKEYSEDGTFLNRGQAYIGDTYLVSENYFKKAQPFPSFTFNEATRDWDPPVAEPKDYINTYNYSWDEENLRWFGYPNSGAPDYTAAEDPQVDYIWNPDTSTWETQ